MFTTWDLRSDSQHSTICCGVVLESGVTDVEGAAVLDANGTSLRILSECEIALEQVLLKGRLPTVVKEGRAPHPGICSGAHSLIEEKFAEEECCRGPGLDCMRSGV